MGRLHGTLKLRISGATSRGAPWLNCRSRRRGRKPSSPRAGRPADQHGRSGAGCPAQAIPGLFVRPPDLSAEHRRRGWLVLAIAGRADRLRPDRDDPAGDRAVDHGRGGDRATVRAPSSGVRGVPDLRRLRSCWSSWAIILVAERPPAAQPPRRRAPTPASPCVLSSSSSASLVYAILQLILPVAAAEPGGPIAHAPRSWDTERAAIIGGCSASCR